MKRIIFTTMILSIATFATAEPFKSPSLGGATGLIGTPTAHTGWSGNGTDLAIDIGFHAVGDANRSKSYIPKVTVQLFEKLELGAAYDIQGGENNNDLLFHGKYNFYTRGSSALAIGGNFQTINLNGNDRTNYQFYLAATYSSKFFSMPAETTIVLGKTMGDGSSNNSIDFSMGFDLDVLPSVFSHYIHWINDFSNYSYSTDPNGSNAGVRGAFNTGLRLALMRDKKYKLNLDILATDVLDSNRSFGLGVAFGLPF